MFGLVLSCWAGLGCCCCCYVVVVVFYFWVDFILSFSLPWAFCGWRRHRILFWNNYSSTVLFPARDSFFFTFTFTTRCFCFSDTVPTENSRMQMRSSFCLFVCLLLVLSCPSVGVANDKGQQSGGYTPPKLLYLSSTFHIKAKEERRETSVRGRKMTGYDLVGIVFSVFSNGLRERRVSFGWTEDQLSLFFLFFLFFFLITQPN